jgi:regulation of enolase protein 1 (concanavalin A-like superfamily)
VSFADLSPGMTVIGQTPVGAHASDDIRIEKVDLLVDGRLHATDRTGPYAFSWDAGTVAPGAHTLELRAHDIAGNRTSASAVVNVVADGGADGLPPGWLTHDIGHVGPAGATRWDGGLVSIDAGGADIWGTADGFRFAYQHASGDIDIIARVASLQGAEPWAKAGVMIRAAADPGAAHAFMLVSSTRGLAFQRRVSAGSVSTHTAGPSAPAPYWVRLVRTGHLFTAYASPDGDTWSVVGSDWVPMAADVLVGLAVTSHTTASLASATFDGLSIVAPQSLPAPWASADIGTVGISGSASAAGGTFAVTGAGADVWGAIDAFHFVWQPLDGDGAIVARLASLTSAHDWTKAGVMVRGGLDPASAHAYMLVSGSRGVAFQRRTSAGSATTHTGATGGEWRWLRLVRHGNLVVASVSHDGATWVEAGRDTISLPATVYIGLAVTSHDASRLATGTFDNVLVER